MLDLHFREEQNKMTEHTNTIIIGAGQAGLSTSYYLKQQGIEHLVLEKEAIGASWRRRWDSFTLVTPNELCNLPDFGYNGSDPVGFLQRDKIVDYLERFAATFDPPLRTGVCVTAVTPHPSDEGFIVETDRGSYHSRNVVVATSIFQQPHIPACAAGLPSNIFQLHSNDYRNPTQLPEGAVLIVGSGQSGAQIMDELFMAGRKVYLSVSRAGGVLRRYRGKDTFTWLRKLGIFEMSVHQLDSPAERFEAHNHVSGRDGGKTINLRRYGRNGVTLLGKVANARNGRIYLADDLADNLNLADKLSRQLCEMLDKQIAAQGVEAPPPTAEELMAESWEPTDTPRELSLTEAGITSVIWATGYRFNFNWIKGLALDEFGYPVQEQGVSSLPGVYFVGLHWLNKFKSGLLYGVAEDAAHVAQHLAAINRTQINADLQDF
jgi:putative flavoprotein involved in K+ transport